MNTIIPCAREQLCKACGEPLEADFAHYDMDIMGVVHGECQLRLMLAEKQLGLARIKKCAQVSGGKRLRGLG